MSKKAQEFEEILKAQKLDPIDKVVEEAISNETKIGIDFYDAVCWIKQIVRDLDEVQSQLSQKEVRNHSLPARDASSAYTRPHHGMVEVHRGHQLLRSQVPLKVQRGLDQIVEAIGEACKVNDPFAIGRHAIALAAAAIKLGCDLGSQKPLKDGEHDGRGDTPLSKS